MVQRIQLQLVVLSLPSWVEPNPCEKWRVGLRPTSPYPIPCDGTIMRFIFQFAFLHLQLQGSALPLAQEIGLVYPDPLPLWVGSGHETRWYKSSLVPRPFPPPVFDRLTVCKYGGGRPGRSRHVWLRQVDRR